MQCVILAAGRGKRMGDLTNNIPKPLLEVKGRPILEYTLINLPEKISEVIFIIGYKGDLIKSYFGNKWRNKKIKYVVQEKLNGTGGALHYAKEFLEDKFLVLNGDDLYYFLDLERLINNEPPALLAKEMDNLGRLGAVKIDADGYLSEIIESGESRDENLKLANIGVYLLNKEFFDYPLIKRVSKPDDEEFGLPQTLGGMAKDYKIKVEKAEFWLPIGYPEDIIKAEKVIDKYGKRL